MVIGACAHKGTGGVAGTPGSPGGASTGTGASSDATAPAASVAAPSTPKPPGAKLTVAEARKYMLQLVNRDRATQGLPAVALEQGPAQRAGQGHAEDMARFGYLGHWGSDGSVPEQRFTDAGGTDMVLENASCFTDEQKRTLDATPTIDPRNVEQTEAMFFDEKPPHDGHRKNILKPWHKVVGIGIAQPVSTATEIAVPCFSQEFVDDYGSFSPVPARGKVGDVVHIEGSLTAPAAVAGVGMARTDAPKPLAVSELNKRRSYPVPAPYQMYWPPGYQTPIPLKVDGTHFAIDVPASDGGRAGLYEVSVWATMPGSSDPVMVSLRTMSLR